MAIEDAQSSTTRLLTLLNISATKNSNQRKRFIDQVEPESTIEPSKRKGDRIANQEARTDGNIAEENEAMEVEDTTSEKPEGLREEDITMV